MLRSGPFHLINLGENFTLIAAPHGREPISRNVRIGSIYLYRTRRLNDGFAPRRRALPAAYRNVRRWRNPDEGCGRELTMSIWPEDTETNDMLANGSYRSLARALLYRPAS